MVVFISVVVVLIGLWTLRCHLLFPEPRWTWAALEHKLDTVRFPRSFLWGTATAHHQIEGGHTHNNWSQWEAKVRDDGTTPIQGGDRCGDAADHWNRWREDIDAMDQVLGVNAYRFSVSWSRIEPRRGEFDADAIAHYHELIDELLARGITPMLTLHHFAHPDWFENIGSFEDERNIQYMVNFGRRMFAEFGEKVPLWCTINEPGPFSVMGWGLGVFPPGKRSMPTLARVIRNLCVAHVRLVEMIRTMPGGDRVQVGLVKNIFQFDPWRRWSPVHWALCRVADHVYNQSILGFLETGRLRLRIPGLMWWNEQIEGPRGDFVGLNYYANLLLDPFMSTQPPFDAHTRPGQVLTDMPYATYAEGLWRALHRLADVGLPIYVTENGIADSDDSRRATWIRRYLFAMRRAMDEGVDVRGFFYWSLLDNFEWAEGFQMRFGLLAVDYPTQARTLRPGAQPFIDTIRRSQAPEESP